MAQSSQLSKIKKRLRDFASPEDAVFLQRFFKTGPGQYGEGDIFIGVRVPNTRIVAKEFSTLPIEDIKALLKSPIHEERLLALIILTIKFANASVQIQKEIFEIYLSYTQYINNWDLVDVTVPHVVGAYLFERPRSILQKMAKSNLLWDRRIAIVSTHYFIRHHDFSTTLNISEMLLKDKEDLIHKATGWMLREVGKRNADILRSFLDKHGSIMPRTMLRYAIEKFTPEERKFYLNG
ncbi:MAG: DNA alkylation repair protein [Candidatus Omnitrophica bacterium]|nr:DNA alkylation repair protein [Candidatus Omnitrophota bacterium]